MAPQLKNFLLFTTFFLPFFIPLLTPHPTSATTSDILIKNFMPYPAPGENEWIELVNISQTSDQDLSELWFVFSRKPAPGYDYTTKYPLTGILAKQESTTVDFSDQPRIPNQGGCLSLASEKNGITFSVQYGDGQCNTGIIPVDATRFSIQRGIPLRVSEGINYSQPCRKFLPEPTYIHYDVTSSTSTTLYLEPAQDPVSDYYLFFGLASSQDEYSVSCPHLAGENFIECKIENLRPDTSYFFRAQTANGCARSSWSNEREVRTKPANLPPTPEPQPLMKNGPTAAEILGIKIASPSPTSQLSFPSTSPQPTIPSDQESPAPKTNFLLSLFRFIINLFK